MSSKASQPPDPHQGPRPVALLPAALLAVAVAAIAIGERRAPARRQTQREPRRTLRNLALGALNMAVVSAVEAPVVRRLARRAEARRTGLAQRLPLPAWARDALAFLLMDYTIYVWHVLTHKVPALWRLHLVHHVDLDMDASTALRFHAADMVVSTPWRAAQVAILGASPRALRWWQGFFLLSVLFHHSNLRLPGRLDRLLTLVLTTPRMHEIHHTAVRDRTDSNWSSGLSVWDRLHGTFRLDPGRPDPSRVAVGMGVPGYRDPAEVAFGPTLRMPFGTQRDAWRAGAGRGAVSGLARGGEQAAGGGPSGGRA